MDFGHVSSKASTHTEGFISTWPATVTVRIISHLKMEKKTLFAIILVIGACLHVFLGRYSFTIVVTSADGSDPGMHLVYHYGPTNGSESLIRTNQSLHVLQYVTSPTLNSYARKSTTTLLPKKPIANLTVQNQSRSTATVINRTSLYCRLRKVRFSTISRKLPPFDRHNLSLFFPSDSLETLVHYNSCAVVSSSHALKLHRYGQDIDAHDAVLRFNCAPIVDFSAYVGSRTDIRLVNTQIPHKRCTKEFWNSSIDMFNNEIVIIRNYDSVRVIRGKIDLKHDRDHSFSNYIKYRKTFPNKTMYFLQRPQFGMDVKNELDRFCKEEKDCKPSKSSPSTGSLGVMMMLSLCDWVYLYEMLPSTLDTTRLAYYYSERTNASTVFHSYKMERAYWRALTVTPVAEVNKTGVAVLRGISQYNCP